MLVFLCKRTFKRSTPAAVLAREPYPQERTPVVVVVVVTTSKSGRRQGGVRGGEL
jgi:hypothetical protein